MAEQFLPRIGFQIVAIPAATPHYTLAVYEIVINTDEGVWNEPIASYAELALFFKAIKMLLASMGRHDVRIPELQPEHLIQSNVSRLGMQTIWPPRD